MGILGKDINKVIDTLLLAPDKLEQLDLNWAEISEATQSKNMISEALPVAKKGSPFFQEMLAESYLDTESKAYDVEQAFIWALSASYLGSYNSQYLLAQMFRKGIGTKKNLDKALYWYQRAAKNSSPDAMLELSKIYLKGELVFQDLNRSNQFLIKAANDGDKQAESLLGYRYEIGLGFTQDLKKAFDYYLKADDFYRMGLCFRYGVGKKAEGDYGIDFFEYADKNGGENGDPLAKLEMAYMYSNGIGVKKNSKLAKQYYLDAAQFGFPKAIYETLVNDYLDNKMIDNGELLFNSLNKRRGSPEKIEFLLSLFYQEGIATKASNSRAYIMALKSAIFGNPMGMNNVGVYMLEINEKAQAVHWFQRAEALGSKRALNNLLQMGLDIKNGKLLSDFILNLDLNKYYFDSSWVFDQGGSYTLKDVVLEYNLPKHLNHLEQNIKENKSDVLLYKANNLMFEMGAESAKNLVSFNKAFQLYQESATLGNIGAKILLASIYENGRYLILPDLHKAEELLKQASVIKNVEGEIAKYMLDEFYERTDGRSAF